MPHPSRLLLVAVLSLCWTARADAARLGQTVTVTNAAQFIQAIGSHRTIKVRPGVYQLDSVQRSNTKHVSWTKVHDGWQLNIKNVTNLSIVGDGKTKPRLLVNARYAWVIRFENARGIRLRGLVLGHIPSGGCMGGVVSFKRSRNINISDSELFGSGTIGVGLDQVTNFHMNRSTIRDCTYGILTIAKSRNVRFTRSTFKGNREFDLIEISRTKNVRFENCTVKHNRTNRGGGYALFKLDKRSTVVIRGGTYQSNIIDTFVNHRRQLRIYGSGKLKRSIYRQMNRPDPRFNQIYKVARYRKWIVTGSQAGIAFWDPQTGQLDLLEKSFISNTFVVDGKYLWAGTYSNVYRFDGVQRKSYLRSGTARGHAVFRGPRGSVMVKQGRRYWRYKSTIDKLVSVTPRWAPPGSAYSLAFDANRSAWSIAFMRGIRKWHQGTSKQYKLRSVEYPGRNPRTFYQSTNGELWISDFGKGFFRYDASLDRFIRDPTVSDKGVGIAVDLKHKRTWLGHYTRGVYLKRPNKPTKFFDFSSLNYMRSLFADGNGDLWIGGWTGLVRLRKRNGKWQRQPFIAR